MLNADAELQSTESNVFFFCRGQAQKTADSNREKRMSFCCPKQAKAG